MSNEMPIDPERMYAIGAASRLVGLSASGLRDCERRGEIASTQTRGGHRRFRGTELLRLREASGHHVATRKPRPVTSNDNTTTSEETKARHTWLGQWIGRAQRELDPATPAEVRLRLAVDLERALGPWGPASPVEDVQPVVTSLIARAKQQAQRADEEAHRHEMKDELIDFALAHLIDSLPRRVVGAAGGLERQQIQALLRSQLRGWLSQHLTGSEDWDRARELTDEWLAQWRAKQGHDARVPRTVKVLTVGAAGLITGAAAVAALSPDLRARAAGLKDRLRSLGADFLKRVGTPPPPGPAAQPPSDQADATPPPSHSDPSIGVNNLLNPRSQARYARYLRKMREARGHGVTTSDEQPGSHAPITGDGVAHELGGSPPASS